MPWECPMKASRSYAQLLTLPRGRCLSWLQWDALDDEHFPTIVASESIVFDPDARVCFSVILCNHGWSTVASRREQVCTEGPQTSKVRRQALASVFAVIVTASTPPVVLHSQPVLTSRAPAGHGPPASRGCASCATVGVDLLLGQRMSTLCVVRLSPWA